MPALPDRAPGTGAGRVVLAGVALLLLAPVGVFTAPGAAFQASVGLLALPVAALALLAPPRRPLRALLAGGAGLLALWWLLGRGELLDQTVRAAAVTATGAFVALSVATRWSVIHRAVAAVGGAAAAVGAFYALLGRSWTALHWWGEYRAGYAMRLRFAALWGGGLGEQDPVARQLGEAIGLVVRLLGDFFPALVALHLIAACVLAAALHRRLAERPVGRPPEPFVRFRFSEHLGWLMVVPLLIVLLPRLAGVKLAAWNVLAVMLALYMTRGLAVAVFGMQLLGGGVLLAILAGLAVVFMLPVVLGTALVLGVLDAGLDLRRRWTAPSSNG